ncbi:hypothetical protein H632_c220p2, partial [Helicosporidium sp. ATCC 50920]
KLKQGLFLTAMQQLNAAIQQQRRSVHGPFNGPVQAALASLAPATQLALDRRLISGMSDQMKRQFGPAIVDAVRQAQAHAAECAAGRAAWEDFALRPVPMGAAGAVLDGPGAAPQAQTASNWPPADDESAFVDPSVPGKLAPIPMTVYNPPSFENYRFNSLGSGSKKRKPS